MSDEKLQISRKNLEIFHFDILSMYLHVVGLKFGLVTE